MSTRPRPRRQHGVTMIELILFIMIIGIALAGILAVMNLTTQRSADPVRRKQALMIAEALMEEVEQAKFSYCDPTDPIASKGDVPAATSTAGCSIPEQFGREQVDQERPYDNVNDYVAVAGAWTAAFNNVDKVLSDANGIALNVNGYSADVRIAAATVGADGTLSCTAGSSADAEALCISVRVQYDGQSLILDGVRTRYAPNSL